MVSESAASSALSSTCWISARRAPRIDAYGPTRPAAARQQASVRATAGEKKATTATLAAEAKTATAMGSKARTTRSPTASTSLPVRAKRSPRRICVTLSMRESASLE